MSDRVLDASLAMLALASFMMCALIVLGSLGYVEPDVPESQQLSWANDTPLLTEQAKQEARETGYAAYSVGGMLHVDGSLPEEYYERR